MDLPIRHIVDIYKYENISFFDSGFNCVDWLIKQDFAAAQARYFSACNATLQQLQKELGALSLQVCSSDISLNSPTSPGPERRQARVICDYDSQDASEMSLIAGEVVVK